MSLAQPRDRSAAPDTAAAAAVAGDWRASSGFGWAIHGCMELAWGVHMRGTLRAAQYAMCMRQMSRHGAVWVGYAAQLPGRSPALRAKKKKRRNPGKSGLGNAQVSTPLICAVLFLQAAPRPRPGEREQLRLLAQQPHAPSAVQDMARATCALFLGLWQDVGGRVL